MSEIVNKLIFNKNITHAVVIEKKVADKISSKNKISIKVDPTAVTNLDNTEKLCLNRHYYLKFNLLTNHIYTTIMNTFFPDELIAIDDILKTSSDKFQTNMLSGYSGDEISVMKDNKLFITLVALEDYDDPTQYQSNNSVIICIISYLLNYCLKLYFFIYLKSIDIDISNYDINNDDDVNLPTELITNMNETIKNEIISNIINDLQLLDNNIYLESTISLIETKDQKSEIVLKSIIEVDQSSTNSVNMKYKKLLLVVTLLEEIPLIIKNPLLVEIPLLVENKLLMFENSDIFKNIADTNCIYMFKQYQLYLLELKSNYTYRYKEYTTIEDVDDNMYMFYMITNITNMEYIILPESLILKVFQICDQIIIKNIIKRRDDLTVTYDYYYIKKTDLLNNNIILNDDTTKLTIM